MDSRDPFDADDPEWTEAMFAKARPAHEVLPPPLFAALTRRGRPRSNAPKRPVSLRLDPEVLEYFRGTGAGWQTRINALLRKGMEQDQLDQPASKAKRA